ncbi:MAG TPA: hypothetical protein VFJ66_06520 [Gaiellales bacterium]|nr:hypothetical protein [Gaiellales bacterium]
METADSGSLIEEALAAWPVALEDLTGDRDLPFDEARRKAVSILRVALPGAFRRTEDRQEMVAYLILQNLGEGYLLASEAWPSDGSEVLSMPRMDALAEMRRRLVVNEWPDDQPGVVPAEWQGHRSAGTSGGVRLSPAERAMLFRRGLESYERFLTIRESLEGRFPSDYVAVSRRTISREVSGLRSLLARATPGHVHERLLLVASVLADAKYVSLHDPTFDPPSSDAVRDTLAGEGIAAWLQEVEPTGC